MSMTWNGVMPAITTPFTADTCARISRHSVE